jgi:hypothetical protein
MVVYLVMAIDFQPWAIKAMDKFRQGFLWRGRKVAKGRHSLLHLYYNGTLKLYLVHPIKYPPLRVFNHCAPKKLHTRISLY